jgi:hypothetical protein
MLHFRNYWSENRLTAISDEEDFLSMLPMSLQKAIMVGYLYDDVFSDFRKFFRPDLYYESDLLMKMAFGLRPRFIRKAQSLYDTDGIIYAEGNEVNEMYFIQSGEIGAGYQTYGSV